MDRLTSKIAVKYGGFTLGELAALMLDLKLFGGIGPDNPVFEKCQRMRLIRPDGSLVDEVDVMRRETAMAYSARVVMGGTHNEEKQ